MSVKYENVNIKNPEKGNVLHRTQKLWRGFELINTIEDGTRPEKILYNGRHHTVLVLLSGRFRSFELLMESQKPITLSPIEGDVYIIPAGTTVIRQSRGGRAEYAELRFPKEAIANILRDDAGTCDIDVHLGIRDEFIHRSARKLSSLITGENTLTDMFGGSLFSALCLYLLMNYGGTGANEREPDRSPISVVTRERLAEYLRANIGMRITLSMMAEIAELPPRQFLQAFHRACGLTPIQHLIRLRIRHACDLLATNSIEIVDIAMRTGFSSHAHFTRTFKERMGISPSEYRKRLTA